MRKKENGRDFLIGFFSAAVAILLRFYVIPNYIMPSTNTNDLPPSAYPSVCCYLLFAFGVLLIIRTILADPNVIMSCWAQIVEVFSENKSARRNVFGSMGIAILYYVIILLVREFTNFSGFYIAAPICIVLLGLWLNWKKLWVLIITAGVTTMSIYLVFWELLNIRIP